MAFEDLPRGVGADFGQGADMEEELRAGSQTRRNFFVLAAFEHAAEAALGRLDGLLVHLPGLEDLEVLPDHGREARRRLPPRVQGPAQQESQHDERRQHEQQGDDDEDHHGGAQSILGGGLIASGS